MIPNTKYEDFVRTRITELRMKKNVSEHKMSLDLDKSGSYIRAITSGMALPSVRELFKIIEYFDMTPAEFFKPLDSEENSCIKLCKRLQQLDEADLKKIDIIIGWFGA